MVKISEMIEKFCPEGVKHVRLGNISEIGTGSGNRQDAVEDGVYPFFVRSKEVLLSDTYEFDEEAILIPGEGGIGEIFHYYKGKYALHQRTYRIHITSKELNTKFFYYYLVSNFKSYILRKAVASTATSIRKPMIEDYVIPIPPLSIQQEIARILDTFTQLQSNLEAELTARQKQYEYYRNKLLTFDENDESVERKAIIDVFDTRNGYTPSTQNASFWENGVFPWFKMEDIREKGHILSDSNLHITQSAIKGKGLFKANSIILATSATIGEHALITVEHLSNQRFTNFHPKKDYLDKIDMKYMYYYFYLIDRWCKEHTIQGNFAGVNMSELYNHIIPIPSLERQREIVSILDTFESLIQNIKQELDARKKQYEYYREKLLTFE